MSEADRIKSLFDLWAKHEVDGDLEAWTAMIADDVTILPPGQPAIRGKEKVREFAASFFELPIEVMEPLAQQVLVSDSGDLAVNFGDLRMVLNPDDGDRIEMDLKCLAVWCREGDDWRISVNTWSSNSE